MHRNLENLMFCCRSETLIICSTNLVATARHGSLRLHAPLSENGTGRVEVFYHGQWGTICDDTWDVKDATVVCRQLGYPDAVRSLRGNEAPRGTGHIWLDQVACTGKEANVTSCTHRELGNENGWHSNDAGVECLSTGKAVE